MCDCELFGCLHEGEVGGGAWAARKSLVSAKRIYVTQPPNEPTTLRLRDVHIHADMVLAGNHFGMPARPLAIPAWSSDRLLLRGWLQVVVESLEGLNEHPSQFGAIAPIEPDKVLAERNLVAEHSRQQVRAGVASHVPQHRLMVGVAPIFLR